MTRSGRPSASTFHRFNDYFSRLSPCRDLGAAASYYNGSVPNVFCSEMVRAVDDLAIA